MYRRLVILSLPKGFIRHNSSNRKVTELFLNQSVKIDAETPEMLDDLSTFGSVLKKSELKSEEQLDLSTLIEDIYLDHSSPRKKPDSSVQVKEIFDSIFESIASHSESKRNLTSDFLAADMNKAENINLSLLKMHQVQRVDSTIPDNYKKSQVLKLKIINLLKPTFDHLNQIKTRKLLLEYIDRDVIDRLNKEVKAGSIGEERSNDELLRELEESNATTPPLNKLTLPVLMEYFINTLVKNFESPSEAISLVYSLKNHPLIYLRACNVDLYNQLLKISWDTNKNLDDIKYIIKDMLLNGFPGDLRTIKILSNIKLEVVKSLSSNELDLFINKFEKYRYHYLVEIERRMKSLTKNNS